MEIESQWTARRREQAGAFLTLRMRSAEETPAQAKLGRATLESRYARERLGQPPFGGAALTSPVLRACYMQCFSP